MTEISKQAIDTFLNDFNKLEIKERSGPTYLEIAKMPYIENVWSNILAFYLNPNQHHKLGSLVLTSLLKLYDKELKPKLGNLNHINVNTEQSTLKGNRIDIVVKGDYFILGIENKVNAALYNDLEDYSNTLNSLKPQQGEVYKIVLSKYKNNTDNGFKTVLYKDFVKVVRQDLENEPNKTDNKYLVFFDDFLNNIYYDLNQFDVENNKEVLAYLIQNKSTVHKVVKMHGILQNELIAKMDRVYQLLRNQIDNLKKEGGLEFEIGSETFKYQAERIVKIPITAYGQRFYFEMSIGEYNVKAYTWSEQNSTIAKSIIDKGNKLSDGEINSVEKDLADASFALIKDIIEKIEINTNHAN